MAGKPGGDLLSPANGENEENRQPIGLAVENAEETSDVSASLFKEISSEEELEVLSGTPNRPKVDGEILGLNGVGNAESEVETSGDDGSLFEEIGGDDSHFGGLSGVQQSAFGTAAHGDNEAGYILATSLRFGADDVPFIRAARGDLDGPLDGPLASLRRDDVASLHTFEEKLSSIFEDIRAKEESSTLAGICRDYGSSSGEEGGEEGVDVILTDSKREGGPDSLPVKRQEGNMEHAQETVEVLMVPMEQGTDVKVISEITLGEQPEVSILPLAIEGNTPLAAGELADGEVLKMISSSSQEAPKKRGRASRELGALLGGNGRRRKAAGLQADVSDSFALAVVRGTTEAGASVDGVGLETPEGIGGRVEVRVTRSRASGRLANKNENVDNNAESLGSPQDVTGKRTGKRSAARGGRLGWGNGLENSADAGLVAGESSISADTVPGEVQIGAGLEMGQGVEDQAKESERGPESKSGGTVKKARGKGKEGGSSGRGKGKLSGSNSHIEESHTEGITTEKTQDVQGLETQSQNDEVLITPPSAGALSNSEAQETEVVDPAKDLESNSGGRRRSNRQKAKVGVQPEADQSLGQRKRKQQRKSAVVANDLSQIPAGSQQTNQEVGSSEEPAGHSKPSEQSLHQNVGDDVEGVGSLEASKEVPAKGRKTAKAKSTNRKGSQKRVKKNVEVSETLLEGVSNGALGVQLGTNADAELNLENGTSKEKIGSDNESRGNAEKSASSGLEKVVAEGCLDTSRSDLNSSLTGQGEGLAKPFVEFGDKIPPVTVSGLGTDVDSSLARDREAVSHHSTEEGANELRTKDTLSEKLETCSSAPVAELVTVPEVNSKIKLEVKSSVSTETAGVTNAVNCEAEGSAGIAVKDEKCPTIVNNNCNMKSSVGSGDLESPKDHDSAAEKESGVEQKATELSFEAATPSARVEGIVGTDHIGAGTEPSSGKAARGGKGRVGGGRKGGANKNQKVETKEGSEVDTKPKGRARKRAVTKKNPADDAAPLVTGEGSVTTAKKKTTPVRRKGKRKLDSEDAAGSVAPSQEISSADGLDPSKDAVVDDVKEPVHDKKTVTEMKEKGVKSRKKGRSTTASVEGGAPKKRRKTEKQLNTDPASVAADVNARSKEEPAGVLPSGGGSEVKVSQPGKAGGKKSQKATSAKKAIKTTPVGDKSKQPKKPPRAKATSKGATVKVLSSIKNQSSDEKSPATKKKSAKPKVSKSNSKFEAEPTDHCAPVDGEAGRVENAEIAVGSAGLIPETNGNVTRELQSEEVVRDTDNGAVGEDISSGVTEGGENKGSEKGIDSTGAETGAARKSWVLCDDCSKWRCIPVELADQIESTNARWVCGENPDKAFQDCSVPQEKSNAEINAELQISEVSVCEEGDDKDAVDSKSMNVGAANEDNKPAVWKRIRRNIFQHRRRKVLEIDEMMVCQCTPPENGGVGCGDNCLNRMLSIECVAEQCPCGEACSNQQFQKRTYAPISMCRCGKKGFGLRVMENVSKGTFIIEYVGEVLYHVKGSYGNIFWFKVLDVSAFETRQQEYALKGQKHFYFMTLNTNEVIDACSKGNYGRFINHSCEPNCKTEKWMVNGEVCIGLFAVRDIAKDEEVTFDYNYVRVCGAAAKKCECGSAQCKGYIGGDPLTPKAVVESDSEDDEDLEPIMVENSEDEDAYVDENKPAPCKKPRVEADFQETPILRTIGIKRKLNIMKEKAQPAVKRVKTVSSARKSSLMNYKGLTLNVGGGRHESARTIYFSDVQDKLDDMLDRNGGLRKKRDAAKQYLKLLVLTSASGDSRKDATACSVRDLSLLLEALLKTTSKTVLSDIMNKNGLRMLHNLIKQLRKQWDKTPILRKLIKVLELLASERVLTTDLISCGPPCSGMESFSESLFELTRHKDTEVVQMVRRFRNRWMPPGIWDRHYAHLQPMSPAMMYQSEQLNMGSKKFQSPQHHPKQGASSMQPHTGSLEVSRPGSSEPSSAQGGGNLPASQSHNGVACSEGATLKDDVKSSIRSSEVGENALLGTAQQGEKKARKRPSRWDAPAKVEKTKKDPSDQSGAQGVDSRNQTTFPAPHISQGSVPQPKALQQAGGPPLPQSGWAFSTPNGFQGSARVPNGGISGQLPQIHHPHTQLLQGGMPQTQHIQPGAPTMQVQMGPTPALMSAGAPPNSNAIQFGPPLPGRGFPHGPSMQMAAGVSSTPQIPMGAAPPALGYQAESRPPPMPQTAPYGQWRPPPGAPNFTGAQAFPMDSSQMRSQPLAWPPQQTLNDGTQRVSSSNDNSLVKRKAEAGVEPEPPVPGLGEPPVPGLSPIPPPPVDPSAAMVWTGSDSHGYREMNEMSERDYYQAQRMPLQYMQGQGFPPPEYYGSRDTYRGDGPWVGHNGEEYWDSPEGAGFREDVFGLVSMRVHKHHKLRTKDLDRFCSKMADVIVRKEVAKYIEQRSQGIEKIIVKTKLIEKVDSYVDTQVGQYLRKIDKSHRG